MAAVEAVRQHAHRILHDEAAQPGRHHEDRHEHRGEADALGVDRTQRRERADGEPDRERADDRHRRDGEQVADAEARRFAEHRVGSGGQRDRQQRGRIEDRGDGEQLVAGGVGHDDEQRPQARAGGMRQDVEREGAPARLVGRLELQPRFGGHEIARHGEAHGGAQQRPDPGGREQRVERIAAAAETAANTVKARMCPTRRMTRSQNSVPQSMPAK